jgi:hypothetical protein
MINVPTLKGHKRAGMTIFAKNHFGSHIRGNASHLHCGLVNPDENVGNGIERPGYGLYRVLVDLMGYSLLRKKNLIFLMDALWSAGWEIDIPTKWKSQPFNNDWSSSIFVSLDNVAIESVGYDFLQLEYTEDKHPGLSYVQMEGVDDYLHQAADSANWTDSIPFYDPEDDGTPMPWSLGVHEHWNDSINKQYSRDLGGGYGIELVQIIGSQSGIGEDLQILARPTLHQNSPNPFNISTSIAYNIVENSDVELLVYNISGQRIKTLVNGNQSQGTYAVNWDATGDNGSRVPNGVYIYRLNVTTGDNEFNASDKMLLIR